MGARWYPKYVGECQMEHIPTHPVAFRANNIEMLHGSMNHGKGHHGMNHSLCFGLGNAPSNLSCYISALRAWQCGLGFRVARFSALGLGSVPWILTLPQIRCHGLLHISALCTCCMLLYESVHIGKFCLEDEDFPHTGGMGMVGVWPNFATAPYNKEP